MAVIIGTPGDDRLVGTEAADTILGGAGSDRIDAGAGNDLIRGGAGADFMLGGAGNDTFLFAPADMTMVRGAPVDTIYDFHGAGGYSATENDFIAFTGFSAAATVVFDGASTVASGLEYYHVQDAGQSYYFAVHFVDPVRAPAPGAGTLAKGDFQFY